MRFVQRIQERKELHINIIERPEDKCYITMCVGITYIHLHITLYWLLPLYLYCDHKIHDLSLNWIESKGCVRACWVNLLGVQLIRKKVQISVIFQLYSHHRHFLMLFFWLYPMNFKQFAVKQYDFVVDSKFNVKTNASKPIILHFIF